MMQQEGGKYDTETATMQIRFAPEERTLSNIPLTYVKIKLTLLLKTPALTCY
jgi:hypothetical protein